MRISWEYMPDESIRWYWKKKYQRYPKVTDLVPNNSPTPFFKRIQPEPSIMLSPLVLFLGLASL
jgi:hypothetical protein